MELVKLNHDLEKANQTSRNRLNRAVEARDKLREELALEKTKLEDMKAAHEEAIRDLQEGFDAEKSLLEDALAKERASSATVYKHAVAQTIMIARRHNHYNGPDADDAIYPRDILDPEYFRLAFGCDPPVLPTDEEDSS